MIAVFLIWNCSWDSFKNLVFTNSELSIALFCFFDIVLRRWKQAANLQEKNRELWKKKSWNHMISRSHEWKHLKSRGSSEAGLIITHSILFFNTQCFDKFFLSYFSGHTMPWLGLWRMTTLMSCRTLKFAVV